MAGYVENVDRHTYIETENCPPRFMPSHFSYNMPIVLTQQWILRLWPVGMGVHKFPKNLGANSKF
jgi:hypothetical protein